MKIIVQFSGGKDSLASLIWAVKKYGKDNVIAVFMDTGWEHELTYKHIEEVIKRIGCVYIKLHGKYTFLSLAFKKKRFPSVKARFCTEELKIKPFIDWVLAQPYNMVIIQGIRAEESESRAKMAKECTYFKYYTQPYKYNKEGKAKYMTYRKPAVLKREKEYATDILRPFFEASASDVMEFILSNGYKPNPLYYMGFKRVGCFPCIMCTKGEMKQIIDVQPKYLTRIEKSETDLQSTFFAIDYIPEYARVNFTTRKGIFKVPTIQAVVRYCKTKMGTMFKEEESHKSCMSLYNICE